MANLNLKIKEISNEVQIQIRTNGLTDCKPLLLNFMKMILTVSFSLLQQSEPNFLMALDTFQTVLSQSSSVLLSSDVILKCLGNLIPIVCESNVSPSARESILHVLQSLFALFAEVDFQEFTFFCFDLTALLPAEAACKLTFPTCSKIKFADSCDVSPRSFSIGVALLFESIAKSSRVCCQPLLVGFNSLCVLLDEQMTCGEGENDERDLVMARTKAVSSLSHCLPGCQARGLECLFHVLLFFGVCEDILPMIDTLLEGCDTEMLFLHCSLGCLRLVDRVSQEKATRLHVILLDVLVLLLPYFKSGVDFPTVVAPHSSFVKDFNLCNQGLARLILRLLEISPGYLPSLLDSFDDKRKRVQRVSSANSVQWFEFLMHNGSFCALLVRIQVLAHCKNEYARTLCNEAIESCATDCERLSVLICAQQCFPDSLPIAFGDAVQSMFYRIQPPPPALLQLMQTSRTGLPSNLELSLELPMEHFVHIHDSSTVAFLHKLTALLPVSILHMKRLVNQIRMFSDYYLPLSKEWEPIIMQRHILSLSVRTELLDVFITVTKGSKAKPVQFLKQVLFEHEESSLARFLAARFGALVFEGISTAELDDYVILLQEGLKSASRKHFALIALGSLGVVTSFGDQLQCIVLLLSEQWTEESVVCRTTSLESLRDMAEAHKFPSVKALFDSMGKDLYPVLIHTLLGKSKKTLEVFVSDVFSETSPTRAQDLLADLFPILLPVYLLDSNSKEFFKTLEQIVCIWNNVLVSNGTMVEKLLFLHVKDWIVQYVEAVVERSDKRNILKFCTLDRSTFIKGGKKKLLQTYVLRLDSPFATKVLSLIAKDCHDPKQCNECFDKTKVDCQSVKYLIRTEFMFMMNTLSEVIQSTQSDRLEIKRQALKCVCRLLILLDNENVDEFVPRVLPTLATALQEVEVQFEACLALKTLTSKLSPRALEVNLIGFVVALLSCFYQGTCQQHAAELLQHLVHNLLSSNCIPLFCDIEEILPKDNSALAAVLEQIKSLTGERSYSDRVERLSGLIEHTSDEVVLIALTEMATLLRSKNLEMDELIRRNSSVPSVLMSALLKTVRSAGTRLLKDPKTVSKSKEISLRCCECLGFLGAVDPARLNLSIVNPNLENDRDRYSSESDLGNKDLGIALLSTFLVDELNSAPDHNAHMQVGFVIQELVKVVGLDSLPQDLLAVVRPFRKTNYSIETLPNNDVNDEQLFLMPGVSFASSIGKWVVHLASLCTGPQKTLFSWLGLLKDSNCATRMYLFILPYAIQNVLCTNSELHSDSILREVESILQHEETLDAGRDQLNIQAIFFLLETLEKWTVNESDDDSSDFPDKSPVVQFLTKVKKMELAKAAFRIGSFSRALYYLEFHVRENSNALNPLSMSLLHDIYALTDSDGLKGVIATRTNQGVEPSFRERISELEHKNNWNEALRCYEEAVDTGKSWVEEGRLRCLWKAGNLDLMVKVAEGMLVENAQLQPLVSPYIWDALWRLGKWEKLRASLLCVDELKPLGRRGSPGGVSAEYTEALSRVFLAAVDDHESISPFLERARLEILGLLSAASMESYERACPLLARIQSLGEIERSLDKKEVDSTWHIRQQFTIPDATLRGEFLAVRRSMCRIKSNDNEGAHIEADSWLSLAKTSRLIGDQAACESALVMHRRSLVDCSEEFKKKSLLRAKIQRAELYKAQLNFHDALQALEPCKDFMSFDPSGDVSCSLAKVRAKALLLHTNMITEMGSLQGKAIVDRFELVLSWSPNWQKALYHLAKYQDSRMQQIQNTVNIGKHKNQFLVEVLTAYANCLKGEKVFFEVLPRILTLWYATAVEVLEVDKTNASFQPSPADVLIKSLKSSLPVSLWYSVLAQLVSRLCHSNLVVWEITRDILILVLAHYPAKALWSVMGVYFSRDSFRQARAKELLRKFEEKGVIVDGRYSRSTAKRYVKSSHDLFDAFIKLAESQSPRPNVEAMLKDLTPFLNTGATQHWGLVLPTQHCLQVDESDPILLHSTGKLYTVISSKEKPKKIQLRGTNGKLVHFLCKHEKKGDLRKDLRLMEINNVVNALFNRDIQARRRRLRLRTYAVVCLNESCGLLEWVENTTGFRQQVMQCYEEIGNISRPPMSVQEARDQIFKIQAQFPSSANRMDRLEAYHKRVLKKFPPIFHRWFLNNFPEPAVWLNARVEFTRSTAVWSMLGFIVGLGDRHAENFLLDVKTGEVVHVDFDCLFDKGLTLTKPEIVPFRLTHNMVDGMGLVGVEGSFRCACEISLQVLRVNKDMLLSILESFVVDPLVEWSRVSDKAKDVRKMSAKSIFSAITERLSGVVRDREIEAETYRASLEGTPIEDFSFERLPLSVAGQVDRLIQDATDEDKLIRMFGRLIFSVFVGDQTNLFYQSGLVFISMRLRFSRCAEKNNIFPFTFEMNPIVVRESEVNQNSGVDSSLQHENSRNNLKALG